MKTFLLWLAILFVAAPALGQDSRSPFYAGAGGGVQFIEGTGTWAGQDFAVDGTLASEVDAPVGFAWTDKAVVGVKPFVGYRISPLLALQIGYALNVSKSSTEAYALTDGIVTYEQGYTAEWTQRGWEFLAVLHPDEDLGYYLFAGWESVRVQMDVLLFETAGATGSDGISDSAAISQSEADRIGAQGAVFGAGFDFAPDNDRATFFLNGRYSTARTDGELFGTPDFKVKVGGFAIMAGVKWYPFSPKAAPGN